MQIRKVSGYEEILELHNIIFGENFPVESYIEKSQQYSIYTYVYQIDERICGYSMIVDKKQDKELYAWYGGVITECRMQGITSEFIDFLINLAKEMKYEVVSLATTNRRPNMLRLAIKKGFEITDIKKRDYGEGNKIYFKYKV